MKKSLFILLLGSVSAFAATINVYKSPTSNGEIIEKIKDTQSFNVINEWVQIKSNNTTGWVKLKDLKSSNTSWSFQQSFSSSNGTHKHDQEQIKKSIEKAERAMNNMFNNSHFFSPFDRPIIIINQKES